MLEQEAEKVYGQAFRPEEGIVIGRLDESGTLVLEVDPTTLPPQISRILSRFDKQDKSQQTALTSKSHELFDLPQNR